MKLIHCIVKVCELSEVENCASVHLRDSKSLKICFLTWTNWYSQYVIILIITADDTECAADNSFAAPGSKRKRRSLAKIQQASVSAGISVQPISAAECQNLSDDQSVCYGNWFLYKFL